MFTGLVEFLAEVSEVENDGTGCRVVIRQPTVAGESAIGDSIALNGVCLTAVELTQESIKFDVGPETLRLTNLGRVAVGDQVNVERPLQPTSRLGGHFVQGHVDGMAILSSREIEKDWHWLDFDTPQELLEQMVPKGSIAVDGISLTIVSKSEKGFRVMLIPHTLDVTTLGKREIGTPVNIETDMIGKYVLSAIKTMQWQS